MLMYKYKYFYLRVYEVLLWNIIDNFYFYQLTMVDYDWLSKVDYGYATLPEKNYCFL